jgi:hypothetical protein
VDSASNEVAGRVSVAKGVTDRANVDKEVNCVRGKVSDRAAHRDEVSRANGRKADQMPSESKNDWVLLPRSGRSWDHVL